MSKINRIFCSIAKRYDIVNTILSFGFHSFWRRDALDKISVPADPSILDLCCGTGDCINEIGNQNPKARLLIGLDFCIPMLDVAKSKIPPNKEGAHPKYYICADAEHTPFSDESFDLITVGFGIRNVENIEQCLRECCRILKSGATLLIIEFGQPNNRWWAFVFDCYSRIIFPIVGGLLTGNQSAYKHLYNSSRNFPCGNRFAEILKTSGFCVDQYWSYFNGVVYSYIARKPF